MQVRPGTAGDTARARGQTITAAGLKRPETNLDYGQSFIELIRRSRPRSGQLPKVIAAYNAGPVPVDRWNYINDKGDPLLWIESLPYWETRYYVPAVLRNMWVYQGLAGAGSRPCARSPSIAGRPFRRPRPASRNRQRATLGLHYGLGAPNLLRQPGELP